MPTTADSLDITRYHLHFDRDVRFGEKLYKAYVQYEDGGNAFTNEYFYRAMTLDELDSYRRRFAFDKVEGHQGWGPNRAYSMGYLTFRTNQTRLVEAYLPNFVTRLKEEGWINGGLEDGLVSWGIGRTHKNGWQGRRDLKARNKNEAMDPREIFHESLKGIRVVNLLTR